METNLPIASIALDAFNLFEGATMLGTPAGKVNVKTADLNMLTAVWVVETFRDFPGNESVLLILRRADDIEADPVDVVPAILHYCDKVALIGAVRNPTDPDDNNWGA